MIVLLVVILGCDSTVESNLGPADRSDNNGVVDNNGVEQTNDVDRDVGVGVDDGGWETFSWVDSGGSPYPVYHQVRALRCASHPGRCP